MFPVIFRPVCNTVVESGQVVIRNIRDAFASFLLKKNAEALKTAKLDTSHTASYEYQTLAAFVKYPCKHGYFPYCWQE